MPAPSRTEHLSSFSNRPPLRLALLFNANKIYDREIVTGIGEHLGTQRLPWEVIADDDLLCRPRQLQHWDGDGIIADFDDPEIAAILENARCPVVAVGSSYINQHHYPENTPYVATDNRAIIHQAISHLLDVGLENLALYSLPPDDRNRWALERECAFRTLLEESGMPCEAHQIYRGLPASALNWEEAQRKLCAWLRSLPKPVGIVAVNDARARHLMHTCLANDLLIPDEVAVIGIDNDPLTRTLCRIPLSSVIQGCRQIGNTAARLLLNAVHGHPADHAPILIPPSGVLADASTQHKPQRNPVVRKARSFIRLQAARGIRVEQVASHVGLSRSTLEQLFKRETSHSVHDEILNTKLHEAGRLLLEGKLSAQTIAERSGFSSLQYMHTVFKRELGCSPREYQLKGGRKIS